MDDECPLSGMCSDQFPFLCDLINSFVSFVGGRSNLFVDSNQLAGFLKTPYCRAMPALSCAAICPFLVTVLATEGANILKFARAVPQKGSFTAQHTILCTSSAHHPLLTTLCHPEPSLCHPEPHSVILNEVKDLHTQFGVSCPVENESKNARSRHEIITEKGVTDICGAFFNFRIPKNIPKNIPKMVSKSHFHSKKIQLESGEIFVTYSLFN